MIPSSKPQALLIFGGLDPSGGAGITADIQTASAFGVHPLVVATTLTAQGLHTFDGQFAVAANLVERQAGAAIDDFQIVGVKIGVIPTRAVLGVISEVIAQIEPPHVIVDPVRRASSGGDLDDGLTTDDLLNCLPTLNPIITPNHEELNQLSTRPQAVAKATDLIALGARAVLLTGGDGEGHMCEHTLYCVRSDNTTSSSQTNIEPSITERTFVHERLAGSFRGTGCALATALACSLIDEPDLPRAVQRALDFTLATLRAATLSAADTRVYIPKRVGSL